MIIDTNAPYGYLASTSAQTGTSQSGKGTDSSQGPIGTDWPVDTVDISEKARAMNAAVQTGKVMKPVSAAEAAGARLRKYVNIGMGYGDANLTAMNFSRKNLGSRIDGLIKGAGIKLGTEEKLAISVDKDGVIKVGGLKDKEKAKAIQEALNDDKKLAREMRSHVVAGRITQNAKKQEEYEMWMLQNHIDPSVEHPNGVDELFTSTSMRAYIIDEYIQTEAGQGLEGLSLSSDSENGTYIQGMSESLTRLVKDDATLESTIMGMLERGETGSDFGVSFEFANGAISDPASLEMAKAKIEGVKAKLMGGIDPGTQTQQNGIVDQVREQLESLGGDFEKEFMDALARGFKIQVKTDGSFDLVGGEGMSGKLRSTLENLVEQALNEWALEEGSALDADGIRVANFADVAETFIEEHRFEHGDVDQYPHMLEINFSGGANAGATVVSPEADEAQDRKNQEVAGELGVLLKDMLGEEGIDASNLEMRIDEDGKITVLGDPANGDVEKAQALIDSFTQEAKAASKAAAGGAAGEKQSAYTDREKVLFGEGEEEDHIPEGYSRHDVVNSGDRMAREDATRESVKRFEEEGVREGWRRFFEENQNEDMMFLGNVSGGVSKVARSPRFATIGEGEGKSGDSAQALYIELLNGMGQFHDARRSVTYSLTAAA